MIDVQLYIYDLSNGVAKQVSLGLLGKQIDAVYHTSIVMNGLEYVYDGGVKAVPAGKTHLGPPMKTEFLGMTELPINVIHEYLESLKEIYTEKTYDIWTHNCNDFSNDFATFLVGHGIPSYISNLPQTVLNSPFGQMIKPYVDRIARQAQASRGGLLGIEDTEKVEASNVLTPAVQSVTLRSDLDNQLLMADKSCAVIFFTSSNCGPCKAIYPQYKKMAEDARGKATFIIVDIAQSREIGMFYSITSTPTFITFLRGTKEKRWSGSDPWILKDNIDLLLSIAYPPHPHESLLLPAFFSADTRPVVFTKIPPLAKLKTKLGLLQDDSVVHDILQFLSSGSNGKEIGVSPSTIEAFGEFLRSAPSTLSLEITFVAVDLFRICIASPRFCAYFAKEKDQLTVASLITFVNSIRDCPYSLRLVTLQLSCNLFTNNVYHQHILGCTPLSELTMQLLRTNLLDDKNKNVRVAAASLAFNITVTNQKVRSDTKQDLLSETMKIELAASLLEAIRIEEQSTEAMKGYLLSLANLVFRSCTTGELADLLKSMEAQSVVLSKQNLFPEEALIEEVAKVLLASVQ
ncbi:putative pul domain-containing protein [Golovinomyces cichoracearum]|uniref:Putative pul domain-containing protein n=1 Tax=Golovinomyces cichoracearum TaxID=62708 RepID=A0A420ICE1_9PEZI|nr:putative pul domain-containing protein [Golovinomyces cichoracearum]